MGSNPTSSQSHLVFEATLVGDGAVGVGAGAGETVSAVATGGGSLLGLKGRSLRHIRGRFIPAAIWMTSLQHYVRPKQQNNKL